jgi:hypothetical protein
MTSIDTLTDEPLSIQFETMITGYAKGAEQSLGQGRRVKDVADFKAKLSKLADSINVEELIQLRTANSGSFDDVARVLGERVEDQEANVSEQAKYTFVREEIRNKAMALVEFALAK